MTTVLDSGESGAVYNIGEGHELENLELARRICDVAGVDQTQISFVPDRPGHDFRYGVSSERLLALGWRPEIGFDEGLVATVEWYRDNLGWLRAAHAVDVVTAPRSAGAAG